MQQPLYAKKRIRSYIILFIGILFQSCITIKQSSLGTTNMTGLDIAKCNISSTGAVYMNLFGIFKVDFMPASTKIVLDSLVVYMDPLSIDDIMKADYIFITHSHHDHFSKSDIKKISKQKTIVIGPKTVTRKIKDNECRTVSIGDTFDFGRIKCEVVESYNIHSKLHKKGSNYVGYVITCDSTRIYIAGDTDFIPEMKDFKNITVAILPIGEGKTAMDPKSAAEAANLIKPEVVIPIHYELGQNRENEFLEFLDDNIEVMFFQITGN